MKNLSSDPTAATAPRQRIQAFVYRDWNLAPAEGTEVEMPEGEAVEMEADTAAAMVLDEAGLREREDAIRRQAWSEARDQLWPEAQRQAELALAAVFEQRLASEHAAVTAALEEFAHQRHRYFARLEREVVQLVLAIARKVMHREAQIDPLLLAGTVRVALDPLSAGAAAELVVAPSQLERWQARLDVDEKLGRRAQLRADPALEPCGCRLETENGTTDLGWENQLLEVEQGFLDLLRRRDEGQHRNRVGAHAQPAENLEPALLGTAT